MTRDAYTVTIATSCRACAMALAGHAPKLRTIHSVFVAEQEEGRRVTRHANSSLMVYFDGSSLACPEHGTVMDLSIEPWPR